MLKCGTQKEILYRPQLVLTFFYHFYRGACEYVMCIDMEDLFLHEDWPPMGIKLDF